MINLKIANGKVSVEINEREMIYELIAQLLGMSKERLDTLWIVEREVNGIVGLYEEHDGSYHGSYKAEYSLITDSAIKVKKYRLYRELLLLREQE